jgi:PPM family protein phosphatase
VSEGDGQSGGASDNGDRMHQEDAWLVARRPGATLCAVCDGMGGNASGAHVADFVLDTLASAFRRGADALGLLAALQAANRGVLARSESHWMGSGTTADVVLFERRRAHVAHVGDGRIYRQREDALVRLTSEHTLLNECLRARPRLSAAEIESIPKNVIVRILGSRDDVSIDRLEVAALPGDRFVLCSDGLTSLLDDAAIAAVLVRHRAPAVAARALLDAALSAPSSGGRDNIAVVVHDVAGGGDGDGDGDGDSDGVSDVGDKSG